jgi:hypothetical protein
MPGAFETVVRLQLDRFSPEEARRRHIGIARAGLDAFLAGQSAEPAVQLEVDGRPAASEEEVKPFGIIRYDFLRMNLVAPFAMSKAREFSPVGDASDARPGHPGLYRASWFFIGPDGHRLDENDIPAGSTIILTNNQPYSRKINSGAKGFERYAPPGVVEKVRQAVLGKFGATINASVVFLHLEGAHVLKNNLRHIYKGRRYGAPRRDARAGMDITYPGVELSPKRFR